MQSVQESICANDIESLDPDTLIPLSISRFVSKVGLLACDVPSHSRPQDASTMVELGKELLRNAKNGDTEAVRELMCRGAPFTTDWLGTSALHLAAQNNHIDTAEVLLRAGISRDARTKVDRTPLHMAAYEGHHQMVQLLLNYGADVNSRDMLKMTPLHWAVEREHVDVIHILLDHGADANATSKFEKTPISLALEHDRLDLVDILQQDRVVIGIQAHQQNQANSAELEVATNNLVQLEAETENNSKSSIIQEEEQQKFGIQQQQSQRKRKFSQAQIEKKQKLIFQQISVSPNNADGEQEREIEDVEMINANNIINSKKHKDFVSIGKQFRLLEAHGIRMIPVDDDPSIVEKAMESGRTVVLTEAGKIALNLTKGSSIKRLQVASRKGTSRKVIAIRTDQIQSKILNPNSNASTTTSRSPNILKKSAMDKAAKLLVTTVSNTSTPSTITEIKNSVSTKEKVANSPIKITESAVLQLDDDIEEITEDDNPENSEPVTDIAVLNKQLAEARKQAAEYRKQLEEKKKEAEIYKQQLKNITAQIASK